MTKGYKTTEFWLTLLATIVGMLIASGAIGEASALGKALAFAASILGGLGYTWSRATVKRGASLVEAAKEQFAVKQLEYLNDPKPAARGKK